MLDTLVVDHAHRLRGLAQLERHLANGGDTGCGHATCAVLAGDLDVAQLQRPAATLCSNGQRQGIQAQHQHHPQMRPAMLANPSCLCDSQM
ncbi:hypothetical protein D3C75_1122850 [compost metagenome]